MSDKIWAAYEACEQYWYWGQTPGGAALLDAMQQLVLKGGKPRVRRRTFRQCSWY